MKEKQYNSGYCLWKEGEDPSFVCIVYKGELKLSNSISR